MSRSGYSDDLVNWALIKWRGQIASAIRGKRGQRLLLDLFNALEAMSEKRLITNKLEVGGEVCALGAVGRMRRIDMTKLALDDDSIADAFDVAYCLTREVMFENDEVGGWKETPEERWARMRKWAIKNLMPVDARPITDEQNGRVG